MNVQGVHPYSGEAGVRDPELSAHRGGGEQICRGEVVYYETHFPYP